MNSIGDSLLRRVRAAAVLSLLASVLTCPVSWAGFDAGQAAFDARDYGRALREWSAAAEQGDARAQFHLGLLYERGLGVEKNIPEAYRWARLAAENGDANAQFALGVLLARGRDIPRDPVESAKWLNRGIAAAKNGDATAQYVLSRLHAGGICVERDEVAAMKWLRSSAELGNADAQSALGKMYAEGEGVEESVTNAKFWLTKAAAQGEKKAILSLRSMLMADFESAHDDFSAVAALRKAAELDEPRAQMLLGFAYQSGRGGVTPDPVQAGMWFLLAALTPEELAQMRGNYPVLSAEQIQEAADRAAAWKQAHPNLPARMTNDPDPARYR